MELQHDPRTKQQIKDLLYETLYAPVLRSFKDRLRDLIYRNVQLTGSTHPSFIFRGEIFRDEDAKQPLPRRVAPLHASLRSEMETYISENSYINTHELPYVIGYINQVLNASDDLPDYLRLFPTSVHQPIVKMIASCACRTTKLDQSEVEDLRAKNAVPIQLMKQRLALNLLL